MLDIDNDARVHIEMFFYSGEELFRDKNRVMLRYFDNTKCRLLSTFVFHWPDCLRV